MRLVFLGFNVKSETFPPLTEVSWKLITSATWTSQNKDQCDHPEDEPSLLSLVPLKFGFQNHRDEGTSGYLFVIVCQYVVP